MRGSRFEDIFGCAESPHPDLLPRGEKEIYLPAADLSRSLRTASNTGAQSSSGPWR